MNPKTFYRTETDPNGVERILTVVYTHDQESGDVRMGASIFRREAASDVWIKKKHRKTALGRFTRRPITYVADESFEHVSDVEDFVRKEIRSKGVCGSVRVND